MEYFHLVRCDRLVTSFRQVGGGGDGQDRLQMSDVFQGIIMWGKEDNKSRKDYTVDRRGDMGAEVGETTFWVKSGF